MSTQATELKRRLLTEDLVDRSMNELIPKLKDLIDNAKIANRKCELSTAQMSNLVNVAGETRSAQVVIGYLQYQVGRDAGRRVQWAWHDFGESLIQLLEDLRGRAEGIVGQVSEVLGDSLTDDARQAEVDRVWMALVRQCLGHLRRYFVYRKR